MEEKLTSRQLQALETKKKIFERALELFKASDFEDVSTTDICKSLNIAVGNFYKYYTSKEYLLMEAYPTFDHNIITDLSVNKFDTHLDAIKFLIFEQTNSAETIGAKLYAQMLRIQIKTEGKNVIEESRTFHTYLKTLIQKALDEGEIATEYYSANELSSLILRISRGTLLDWAMQNGAYSVSERVLHDVDLLFKQMKVK